MTQYSAGRNRRIGIAVTVVGQARQGGFTLLEVLIAFLIASLALGAMIGAANSALQATRTATRYQEATIRAQSKLDEAVNGGALTPGAWDGDDGSGYHWRVQVAPATTAISQSSGSSAAALTLYAVAVWITWQDGTRTREIRLDTEHIGQVMRAP
jgi:general secretion pathway protein I